MCGLVGILNLSPHGLVDRNVLGVMTRALAHRGPDDEGMFLDGPIGLGHRRLAVIDLAAGHQPMVEKERGQAIVFNGEIYNYQEIRKRLQAKGSRFFSNSDTEVLLRLGDTLNTEWISQLNGMFAFALWDQHTRRLLLARDRLGIKPLYYTIFNEFFLFDWEVSEFC